MALRVHHQRESADVQVPIRGPLGPGVNKTQKSRKRVGNPKNLKNSRFRLFFEFFWLWGRKALGTPCQIYFGVF